MLYKRLSLLNAASSAAAAVVAIIVAAGVGFSAAAPVVPSTYTTQVPFSQTTVVPQTNVIPVTQTVTHNDNLWSVGSTTLQPNYYVDGSASLPAGRDVAMTWSASDTVDAFIFSSDQFALYQSNGQGTALVQQTNTAMGTISFRTSAGNTYYFVLHNPHNGFFGIGSKNVGVFSGAATDTWQEVVTSYSTTTTFVTSTIVQLRTATNQCSLTLLSFLLGRSCGS